MMTMVKFGNILNEPNNRSSHLVITLVKTDPTIPLWQYFEHASI